MSDFVSKEKQLQAAKQTDYGRSPLFRAMQIRDVAKARKRIKTVLELNPDAVKEKEPLTGNSALHVAAGKEALRALLQLRPDGLDIDEGNLEGRSALHWHTNRGDLGSVLMLASYGADLNKRDGNGFAAMHTAVLGSSLNLLRGLLVLGADPNIENIEGDTPLHLAVKLTSDNRLKIIQSLSLCGAVPCLKGKVGCEVGCAGGTRSSDVDDGTAISMLDSPGSCTNQMGKIMDINQLKHKKCMERAKNLVKNGEENGNGLEDLTQTVNLLAMDGGGIRGLAIIQILLHIEKMLGETLFPLFHWVIGTSTGSFIAGGLCTGKDLRECQQTYLRLKEELFEGKTRPYDTATLENFLKIEMGADRRLADIKQPKVIFTTVKADKNPLQLELSRNFQLPLSAAENEAKGYKNPTDILLWKTLRRSSAAPTYFLSADKVYLDGGLIANNPTLDLLTDVQRWNSAVEFQDKDTNIKREPRQVIRLVLSIGSGQALETPMKALNFDLAANVISNSVILRNLGQVFIEQVTNTDGGPVDKSRAWCHSLDVPFFRFSPLLPKEVPLDTKDDLTLVDLMWETEQYMNKQSSEIKDLVELLKSEK